MQEVRIEGPNLELLENLLRQKGLSDIVRPRSGAEAILIALGGGAGIAAIIKSIGWAINKYFEGHAKVVQASKDSLTITANGIKIKCDSKNATEIASKLLQSLKKT